MDVVVEREVDKNQRGNGMARIMLILYQKTSSNIIEAL